MKYWLMKSEPEAFSLSDLKKSTNQTTTWDGVRNYQARNYMRDEMKIGDKVLFYHSNTKPPGVVGIATVVKESYPDFTAFDPDSKYYDPKSKKDNPRWYMVDVKFEKELPEQVSLEAMKDNPKLETMRLLQKGNRLSVMPVEKNEFVEISKMGGL